MHVTGCSVVIYNVGILLLKGWQLPDEFSSVRTIYTNLHTKIFLLKHGKFEKKINSRRAQTSLLHLTSFISL